MKHFFFTACCKENAQLLPTNGTCFGDNYFYNYIFRHVCCIVCLSACVFESMCIYVVRTNLLVKSTMFIIYELLTRFAHTVFLTSIFLFRSVFSNPTFYNNLTTNAHALRSNRKLFQGGTTQKFTRKK